MADLTISSDTSAAAQAYELAQQNIATAAAKSGKHVVGTGLAATGTALGATAAASAVPTDSIQATGTTGLQSKAVANTDAPNLPSPSGNTASPSSTMRVVKGSEVFASGGDGVFAALEAMSDARQKDVNSAMLGKRMQSALQITAKEEAVDAKKNEIHGMEVSAGTSLGSAFAGLGLSIAFTEKGMSSAGAGGRAGAAEDAEKVAATKAEQAAAGSAAGKVAEKPTTQTSNLKDIKKDQDKVADNASGTSTQAGGTSTTAADAGVKKVVDKEQNNKAANAADTASDQSEAHGARWRNLGMNITQSVGAVHDMIDTDAGGKHEQNQAQLDQKQDDVKAQVAQVNVDSASSWLDSAKDQRKAAQQAIVTHVQMWGDSSNNVWK